MSWSSRKLPPLPALAEPLTCALRDRPTLPRRRRTGPPPLAGARRAQPGGVDDHRRRHGGERGHPHHHRRPRPAGDRRRVDEHDLLAGVRRPADQRGPRRRPLGPPPLLPGRGSRLRALQPLGGPGVVSPVPDRRPLRPGHRRGDDPPRHPLLGERHVPGPGPGDRLRGVGIGHRRDGRPGAPARRLPDHRALLAMDLLHQPPHRGPGGHRGPGPRPRDEGPLRSPRRRPPGDRHRVTRVGRRRVRHHRGPALRVAAAHRPLHRARA